MMHPQQYVLLTNALLNLTVGNLDILIRVCGQVGSDMQQWLATIKEFLLQLHEPFHLLDIVTYTDSVCAASMSTSKVLLKELLSPVGPAPENSGLFIEFIFSDQTGSHPMTKANRVETMVRLEEIQRNLSVKGALDPYVRNYLARFSAWRQTFFKMALTTHKQIEYLATSLRSEALAMCRPDAAVTPFEAFMDYKYVLEPHKFCNQYHLRCNPIVSGINYYGISEWTTCPKANVALTASHFHLLTKQVKDPPSYVPKVTSRIAFAVVYKAKRESEYMAAQKLA
jgi:hypothetical protein